MEEGENWPECELLDAEDSQEGTELCMDERRRRRAVESGLLETRINGKRRKIKKEDEPECNWVSGEES